MRGSFVGRWALAMGVLASTACITTRERVVQQPVYTQPAPAQPPPPPVVTSVSVWDGQLAPYGSWVISSSYGRVWVPNQGVVGAGWRPYTYGSWELTEYGWTWVDDYAWAYPVHHYGRWGWDPIYGWVWMPDTVWGPAWVTWRTGGGYVGWAPLPPGGGVGMNVIIADGSWVFIDTRYMGSPGVYRYVIWGNGHRTCLTTTVIYRDVRYYDNRGYDYGPGHDYVRGGGGRVRPVRITDLDDRSPVFQPDNPRRPRTPPPNDHGPSVVRDGRPQPPSNGGSPNPGHGSPNVGGGTPPPANNGHGGTVVGTNPGNPNTGHGSGNVGTPPPPPAGDREARPDLNRGTPVVGQPANPGHGSPTPGGAQPPPPAGRSWDPPPNREATWGNNNGANGNNGNAGNGNAGTGGGNAQPVPSGRSWDPPPAQATPPPANNGTNAGAQPLPSGRSWDPPPNRATPPPANNGNTGGAQPLPSGRSWDPPPNRENTWGSNNGNNGNAGAQPLPSGRAWDPPPNRESTWGNNNNGNQPSNTNPGWQPRPDHTTTTRPDMQPNRPAESFDDPRVPRGTTPPPQSNGWNSNHGSAAQPSRPAFGGSAQPAPAYRPAPSQPAPSRPSPSAPPAYRPAPSRAAPPPTANPRPAAPAPAPAPQKPAAPAKKKK